MPMEELLTTAEVAGYLRLKERKIYDLVRDRRIPCARVAGKWLFPRALVDRWVAQHTDYRGAAALAPPPVIAGSHDPLLDWAVRESRCQLALLTGGSTDGLNRLIQGHALAAGLHIIDPASGRYNTPALTGLVGLGDIVLIQWAWREQGLLVAPGNPLGLQSMADVVAKRARLACRQSGAGAQVLLGHLLDKAGARLADANAVAPIAQSETELAELIADGKADCGLAVRAAARRFRLDFIPLHRERFDLAMRRRDYFDEPMQTLLDFSRNPGFAAHAQELTGYDLAGAGRVVYNA